ncbi:MAG: glycoside hydrolase family 88 protein [Chlorobi bacterium]|nr:glycoside hydrolase family 88 protein [Chlorobiota bacterium]
MKAKIFRIPIILVLFTTIQAIHIYANVKGQLLFSGKSKKTELLSYDFKKELVYSTMKKVADWQLANPHKNHPWTWQAGTFWAGLMDFYEVRKEERYLQEMYRIFNRIEWKVNPCPYNANVLATAQSYIDFYGKYRDPEMIQYVRYVLDMQFARHPKKPDVTFEGNAYWKNWWSWCDALFMAPPAWAKFSAVTGEERYINEMDRLWHITYEYLYDKKEHLYYRDDRFFKAKSKTGKKVFWSRGNGWVMGGLVKTLEAMPKDYKSRAFYEKMFKDMAASLLKIQQPEGYWASSLLDRSDYESIETSGTAFFCYALAWGINNGYLDKNTYLPAVKKSWKLLVKSIHPDGKLGYVQRVGDAPDKVLYDDNEYYGSGAFLMAGSEVYKLSE